MFGHINQQVKHSMAHSQTNGKGMKQAQDWAGQVMSSAQITKQWNAEQGSVSELVPWLFGVPPATVCCKDSGLLAVYELQGLDVDSSTNNELNKLTMELQSAVSQLMQAPVYLWFQARRLLNDAWPTNAFPDAISARLDQLRQDSFDDNPQYTNTHYLCVLMQPPKGLDNIAAKLAALTKDRGDDRSAVTRLLLSIKDAVTGDTTRDFKYSAVEFGEAIVKFEGLLDMFTSSLGTLSLRRLEQAELGGYLASTLSLARQSFHLRPITPAYGLRGQSAEDVLAGNGLGLPRFLDTRLPDTRVSLLPDVNDGKTLELLSNGSTTRYVRVTSVTDFPASNVTFPTQLDSLMYVPGELVFNVVFQCVPKGMALKMAEAAKKYHGNRKFSIKQMLNSAMNKGETSHLRQNTSRSAAEENAALIHDAISMERDLVGLCAMTVLSIGDTPEESVEVAAMVDKTLASAQFVSKVEDIHVLSAFTSTVPGMYHNTVRWMPAAVANIADIAPVRTVAMGHESCEWLTDQMRTPQPAAMVLPTRVGTPYWFDFFANGPGHFGLVGPAGAGKSVLGGMLMSMFRRYPGAQVIALVKDRSLCIPILLQGGTYSDLSPESTQRLSVNPLALLQEERHLPWAFEWVVLLLTQNGSALSGDDRLELQKALKSLTVSAVAKKAQGKVEVVTLSRLFALMPPCDAKNRLREWVRTENGLNAQFFDNETDAFDLSALQGFEMGSILSSPLLAVPFTEYMFYRIEQHLKNMRAAGSTAPTLIYISEIWHLLSNPVYESKLIDWLKTLRKLSGVVGWDTQSLDELAASKAFATLRDNVLNMFFLANDKADTEAGLYMYCKLFGLTHEQAQLIAGARRKRDYFLKQGKVARMIELPFGEEELAMLRSDNLAQASMDKAIRARDAGHEAWRDVYFESLKSV
jgi:type IV secretion system protein TrbE